MDHKQAIFILRSGSSKNFQGLSMPCASGLALIMSVSSTPAAGSFSLPEGLNSNFFRLKPSLLTQAEAIQEIDEGSKAY